MPGGREQLMQIVHRSEGDVLVVEVLEVRLATNAARDFGEQLAHLIELGHRRIILNLQRVRFIDSSGLGMIVMVQRRLVEGGEIAIVSSQEPVLTVLKLTRMNKIFRIFPDEAAAAAALGQSESPQPQEPQE
jgi:anti-sigma B factor antagonist